MKQDYLQLHPLDNVGVLFQKRDDIPAGHKIALTDIQAGEKIIKYGNPIGRATCAIRAGEWVHSHNLKTALGGEMEYEYTPAAPYAAKPFEGSFMGYLRKDGKAGIRNEIWVLPLVGCVNRTATRIAESANKDGGTPVYAFTHPYGCSQLGEDHDRTKQLLLACAAIPTPGVCWCWALAVKTTPCRPSGKPWAKWMKNASASWCARTWKTKKRKRKRSSRS